MTRDLTLDAVREQVDSMFADPQRRKRALDWCATPEGRESLEAHRQSLRAIQLPHEPEEATA